jgi:hypothetical protein
MAKSKSRESVTAHSLSDLVEWFDGNDTGDYLKQMPEVNFDVDIKRRKHLVSPSCEEPSPYYAYLSRSRLTS